MILWLNPITSAFMLPLIYLNTHVHELGHALTAILTGGRVDYIHVYGNGSGVAPVAGGFLPLIAMAGYVGSSAVGGLLIAASHDAKQSQVALRILTGLLLLSLIAFVRGDGVGLLSIVLWITALFVVTRVKSEGWQRGVSLFIGLQLALTSLHAFMVLWGANVANAHSDAEIMERVSGIPAAMWSVTWLLISIAAIYLGLKQANRAKLP